MNDVMRNYSTLERPVLDHNQPLVVQVKFILQQIVDVVSHAIKTASY